MYSVQGEAQTKYEDRYKPGLHGLDAKGSPSSDSCRKASIQTQVQIPTEVSSQRHIASARKLAHKTVHTRQIILGVQAFCNHTARARNVPTRTTPTLVRSR